MARRFSRISRVAEKCCSLSTSCIYVSRAILKINGSDFRSTSLFDFVTDTVVYGAGTEYLYIVYNNLLVEQRELHFSPQIPDQTGSGPTQTRMYWIPEVTFPRVRQPGREANYSPLILGLRMCEAYFHSTICLHGMSK